ncbi:MAG: NAD-dependent epimerase/dehydratase family protein, partial [bacterium]
FIYDNFVRGKIENLRTAKAAGRVKVIRGDIRDVKKMKRGMKGMDYVFHLASAWLLQCLKEPRLALDVNVAGSYNVLEAAVQNNVKKLIFSSSASVFGDPLYFPVDEEHPFNTNSAYGASKVAGEQFCEVFHKMYGLKYVALRYFNVFGPRQDVKGAFTQVIPKWLDCIDAGKPITVFGDGMQTMDLIYVGDVARANILALKSRVESGVFNIGTGRETSANQLAEVLIELTGSNEKIIHKGKDINLVNRRKSSTKKAEKLLDFKSRVGLKEGLKALMDWRASELKK